MYSAPRSLRRGGQLARPTRVFTPVRGRECLSKISAMVAQGRASALLEGVQTGELAGGMADAGRRPEAVAALQQLLPAVAALGGASLRRVPPCHAPDALVLQLVPRENDTLVSVSATFASF
jgi:hypothetical protein